MDNMTGISLITQGDPVWRREQSDGESSCMLGCQRTEVESRLREGGSGREGALQEATSEQSRNGQAAIKWICLLRFAWRDSHLPSKSALLSSGPYFSLWPHFSYSSLVTSTPGSWTLLSLGSDLFPPEPSFVVTDFLFTSEPTWEPSQVPQVTTHLSFWLMRSLVMRMWEPGPWASSVRVYLLSRTVIQQSGQHILFRSQCLNADGN